MIPYPWQIQQWQALCARWQAQKLPHALLFAGPKDLGKLDFALAFAKNLLCKKASAQQNVCDCQSCKWFDADTHPDFFMLQPEPDGDSEKISNKAIKIEQVRELLTSLQQTAQQSGGQQVVIIEPAEAMNKAASNALLKMLEEPTGPIIFLLVTHQPGLLLATIRSRCQKIDFLVPSIASSLAWLKNQLSAEQNIELLLALAENIPLRALMLAENSRLAAHRKLISQFIQFSMGNVTPLEMASLCAEIPGDRVYESLYLLAMDLVRLQQFPESAISHLDQRESLKAIIDRVSAIKIFSFLDKLMEAKKSLNAKIHLNMSLLWEALFIEWLKC